MEVLYLDNVRGFSESIIPIQDVTFLVGENSTGKSSLLALYYLMLHPKFLFEGDFDTDDINLGGFRDLVSEASKEKRSFTIGQGKKLGKGDLSEWCYYFATFESEDGLPVPKRLSILSGNNFITLQRTKASFYYRVDCSAGIGSREKHEDDFVHHLASIHKFTVLSDLEPIPINNAYQGLIRDRTGLYAFFMVADEIPKSAYKDNVPRRREVFSIVMDQPRAVWLAPIRTKPRRTYDATRVKFSSEGEHTPYIIKKELKSAARARRFRRLLKQVGSEGRLFDGISIREFSRSGGSPFVVEIEFSKSKLSISNVGYGVSQALPIIVECITQPKGSTLLIQQPEVHLHPRAQAALGELLYFLSVEEKKRFIVETHSDFLIDRFRTNIRDRNNKVNSSILFFKRIKAMNSANELLIGPDGTYPEHQPEGFRDFFLHEQLRVLDVQ